MDHEKDEKHLDGSITHEAPSLEFGGAPGQSEDARRIEASIVRRIDVRMMTTLVLIYILN